MFSIKRRTIVGLNVITVLSLLAGGSKWNDSSSRRQIAETTPGHQETVLLQPLQTDGIVIFKSQRRLELFANGRLVRSYRIGLGFDPVEDKQIEGDGRTPEGDFYVFVKNPKSAYYLSLGISYPNFEDADRGLRQQLISKLQYDQIVKAIGEGKMPPQNTALGGLIYIHGNGAKSDWTLGCIALDNQDMKELYGAVEVGTKVTIKP
jgi:murein L,D-transpeptidase YafK